VYLPCSNANIAILKPSPSSPSKFSLGTRTSCSEKYPVLPARIPNFPWIVPEEKPFMLRSTMKHDMPL
jgi:hypothetical protein